MKQRLHTERKENKYKKRDSPLEPRYAGICKFTTKIFQTPTQKGGWYEFSNPFAVHLVNPLFLDEQCAPCALARAVEFVRLMCQK
jgi:hypothetical protein